MCGRQVVDKWLTSKVVNGEEVLIERPIAYMSKKLGDEAKLI